MPLPTSQLANSIIMYNSNFPTCISYSYSPKYDLVQLFVFGYCKYNISDYI